MVIETDGTGDFSSQTIDLPDDFDATSWREESTSGGGDTSGVDSHATDSPAPAGVSPSTNIEFQADTESGEVVSTELQGQGSGGTVSGGTDSTKDQYATAAGADVSTTVNAGEGMDAIEQARETLTDVASQAAESGNEAEDGLPLQLLGVLATLAALLYGVFG